MNVLNRLSRYYLSKRSSTLKFTPVDTNDKARFLNDYLTSVGYSLGELVAHTPKYIYAWVCPAKASTRHFLKFKYDGTERDVEYALLLDQYGAGELLHTLVHSDEFLIMSERWRVLVFDETFDVAPIASNETTWASACVFADQCMAFIDTSHAEDRAIPFNFSPTNINRNYKFIDASTLFRDDEWSDWSGVKLGTSTLSRAYQSLMFTLMFFLFRGRVRLPWHLRTLSDHRTMKRDFDAQRFIDEHGDAFVGEADFVLLKEKTLTIAGWLNDWRRSQQQK